jgi:hypothetical protein
VEKIACLQERERESRPLSRNGPAPILTTEQAPSFLPSKLLTVFGADLNPEVARSPPFRAIENDLTLGRAVRMSIFLIYDNLIFFLMIYNDFTLVRAGVLGPAAGPCGSSGGSGRCGGSSRPSSPPFTPVHVHAHHTSDMHACTLHALHSHVHAHHTTHTRARMHTHTHTHARARSHETKDCAGTYHISYISLDSR